MLNKPKYEVRIIAQKTSETGEKVAGDDYAYKLYAAKSKALEVAKKLSLRKTFMCGEIIHEVWVTIYHPEIDTKEDWFFKNGKLTFNTAG
jgi:hypothetical protein